MFHSWNDYPTAPERAVALPAEIPREGLGPSLAVAALRAPLPSLRLATIQHVGGLLPMVLASHRWRVGSRLPHKVRIAEDALMIFAGDNGPRSRQN